MELNFIPLDYNSFDFEGKSHIKIFGKTSTGKRICLIDSCDSYFWAILKPKTTSKKIKKLIEKINKIKIENSKVIKTELHEKKLQGENVKALKILVSNSRDIKKIAEKIKLWEIEKIREVDLNFITRYIIEKKLVPGNWYNIKGEIIDNQELDVDFCIGIEKIEKIEREKKFVPKVLAFDIETEEFEIGRGEIFMMSLVSENFKKVLSCKKCSEKLKFVECFSSEKQMLEAFVKYIKEISPDILTGYFSDGFDLPYLKARAEKNKIKLCLGLDNSIPKFSGGRNPRGKIKGRVHVDLFQFIKTAYSQYLQSETLGLGDVANELLGEKKFDYEFKQKEKMKKNDWEEFFKYNLQDSILTYNLFMKAWPDMLEFSRVMQEPLFEVSRNGMSANVENYIIHNLEKYNEIIEQKPTHEMISTRRARERYTGAFVLQPIPKLYENIAMFDFTSYWPSIIATFNLSSSTYRKNKTTEARTINIGNKKLHFSKKIGFFPDMLKEIILLRKKFKKEYQSSPSPILKARSNAFKLLANASYGYQGFFGARYYCPEASAATTAISRDFIKKVIDDSKKAGFNAIYSDTDSIALEQKNKTKKQSLEFLKKINSKLPGIMELELEDFYKRGIWVTTRKGEIGAKKKYALINENGKMKVRGFETVRRDWCGFARKLQNEVLEKILKNGNEKSALEFLKEKIKKIKSRNIEKKDLIIKTQLKKPLSEYKAVTPHVTIAKKMLAMEIPVNQGMLIQYFIAESKDKKALTRDRAVFPDDSRDYDIRYYLEKQILPAVENIFQVFNINVNELLENDKQMKLF